MNEEWQGQNVTSPIGHKPTGFWSDPKVKEAKETDDQQIAQALRYFIANPDELGLPTHISPESKQVYFDNGSSHSYEEVIESHQMLSTEKDASFFDGPVDLGKEHDGDFPSVTWMPRGQEDKDVNDNALTAEKGAPLSVFNAETAPSLAERIKKEVKAPYVNAQVSTLGGKENVSILVTISLDDRSTWANNILQNSNYGNFSIDNDGTIEHFSGRLPKFRKRTAKNADELIRLLNTIPTAKPLTPVTPTTPPAATASVEKKAETNLDPDLLQKAVEHYVKTSPDIDWFEQYAEQYVDSVQADAEEHGKRLHSNVIDHMLEDLDETELMEMFLDTEVESWLSTLEGINTEEALDETYPKVLESYRATMPKPTMGIEYTSALEAEVPEEQKTQIAAKWGPEYLSALAHFNEASKNKHPRDRALAYAMEEMKKQNITILQKSLSEVVDIYAN